MAPRTTASTVVWLSAALAAAWLSLTCAWAQPPGPGADAAAVERSRIAAEREEAMRRFDAEEAACRQRFAVTPCVDEVRERRRAALAGWRESELRLDEAERRERARRRLEEIAARTASAASAPAPTGTAPAAPRAAASAAPAARPASRPEAAASSARPSSRPASAGARAPADAADAARRARAAEERRREADAAPLRIEKREAERAARGRVEMPLPMPSAASAPSRP